jgi:hypothetical protein
MMLFGKFRSNVLDHKKKIMDRLEVHGSTLNRPQRDAIEMAVHDAFYYLSKDLDILEENTFRAKQSS